MAIFGSTEPQSRCQNDRDLPFELQSIQEPLGNAVHTVLAGEIAGQTVAVVGCGPIGIPPIPSRLRALSHIPLTYP